MSIATAVLLVVAAASAVAAVVVRSETADLEARAEPVVHRTDGLRAENRADERRLRSLAVASRHASVVYAGLLAAFRAQVDASNRVVDLADQAVDRYNTAQVPLATAFGADVDAALTDLEQKTAAVHTAGTEATKALDRVRALHDG